MLKYYDDIILDDIYTESADFILDSKADYYRVAMPVSVQNEVMMQKRGFVFADRTIQTTINLLKQNIDYKKYIRLPIVETELYKEEILNIAVDAFNYDRRFHISASCSKDVSKKVLRQWINETQNVFVALFKDKVIGFMALKEIDEETLFIHLAATDEKYRLTGAAMALYANACKHAVEHGYKKLQGRISSQNMPVMNLYTFLGCQFSDPQDVFLGEKDGIK